MTKQQQSTGTDRDTQKKIYRGQSEEVKEVEDEAVKSNLFGKVRGHRINGTATL